MSDTLLRKLERKALATQEDEDILAYWRAALRAGELPKPNIPGYLICQWLTSKYMIAYDRIDFMVVYMGVRHYFGSSKEALARVRELLTSYLDFEDTKTNPTRRNGDELLRKLERDGDEVRLELEKHRRGLPSKICQACNAKLAVSHGFCECCHSVSSTAGIVGSIFYGYAPSSGPFFQDSFGYPLAYMTKHTTSPTGWRNVTGRRSLQHHYRFIDALGQFWHGKGAGPGMSLILHKMKVKPRPNAPGAHATRERQAAWRVEHGC